MRSFNNWTEPALHATQDTHETREDSRQGPCPFKGTPLPVESSRHPFEGEKRETSPQKHPPEARRTTDRRGVRPTQRKRAPANEGEGRDAEMRSLIGRRTCPSRGNPCAKSGPLGEELWSSPANRRARGGRGLAARLPGPGRNKMAGAGGGPRFAAPSRALSLASSPPSLQGKARASPPRPIGTPLCAPAAPSRAALALRRSPPPPLALAPPPPPFYLSRRPGPSLRGAP